MEKDLREYQEEALKAIATYLKGKIILPTGSGKSLIMQEAVSRQLTNGAGQVVVLHYPRISLLNEQADKLSTYLQTRVTGFDIVPFHSGGEQITWTIRDAVTGSLEPISADSTTDWSELYNILLTNTNSGVNTVILSTYNSADKVQAILKDLNIQPELELNDESQFLSRSCFFPIVKNSTAKKRFFFTATPTETTAENGRGMQNPLFGPKDALVERTVKYMVENKFIVPVKPVGLDNKLTQDEKIDTTAAIVKAFETLKADKGSGKGAKLIVFVSKLDNIEDFLNSPEREALLAQGVNIASVGSRDGITTVNHNKYVSREYFMEAMHEKGKSDEDMIILNYDILSEGIDVPGFNGILLMRNAEISKAKQIIGRGVRCSDAGDKKYAMLFYPTHDADAVAEFEKIILSLYELGYTPSEVIKEISRGGGNELGDNNLTDKVFENASKQIEANERLALIEEISNALGPISF
jgi:superfamily II DNA or RNA helicase